MRVLCVAEKPSISKAISQILSGGQFTTNNTRSQYIKNYEFDYPHTRSSFTVTCVTGHLTAQDFYDTHRKWNSCDAFELFDAPVETMIPSDKKDIESNLMTQARRAQVLMIWTDCDREGEHIGMEIAKVCRKANPTIRVKRARFSAIIAQQIHNAAQNPVELDRRQADAVEARIILDLKVGAAFTRLQTLVLQGRVPQMADSVVSYGPCQFPTLGFVVQRYSLVKNFTPETFWYIYLSLRRPSASQGEEETKFNWKRNHLFDEFAVTCLYEAMGNSMAVVTKVDSKSTKKWKPLPLTTVELQKAGSRLLKLAPKKVLDIAEKLYQKGFLSYPRTETDQFDNAFDHMSLIAKQTADPIWGPFATSLQQGGYNAPRKGKNNDKAHPPIHPTAHANNLEGDEKRVYEYITRRYLACCSKDAEGWQTTVEVVCGGEQFSATGLTVRERNYLVVYIYDRWTGHTIPPFEEGEEFQPTLCEIRQGQTSKPNYLTEADLVNLMDKNGIGTDATIAQHIQTIIDRDYVIERMEGATKYLIPSTLGIGLIEGYNRIGLAKNVSKPQMRRETERKMVQVCEGTVAKRDMIEQALEQYKEMFTIVRRDFERVTSSVQQYLSGRNNEENPQNRRGGPGGDGGGGRPRRGGGGGGDGEDDNDDAPGGRGTRARGRGTTRGARAAPAGRGRGRGRGGADNPASAINNLDDNLSPPAPVSLQQQSASTGTLAAASSSTTARDSRQTAPIYMSSSWTAGPPPAAASTSSTVVSRTPSIPIDLRNNAAPPPDEVRCRCNAPATENTVTSDKPTKGRKFWKCATGICTFFQWVDDIPMKSSSAIPTKRPFSDINSGTSESTGNSRQCKCGDEAVKLTVVKEGKNQGRNFWKCKKREDESPCSFFEWDDELPRNIPSGLSNSAGSARQCQCQEEAVKLTVQKEGKNQGRLFWKCRKREDENPCSFFEWDDEPPRNGSGYSGNPSRSASLNNGGTSSACFKCGQEGHFANACTGGSNDFSSNKRSRSFGNSASNQAAGAECFKCHQIGHYSSSCPNGSSTAGYRPNSSSGKAASSDECFKCGKTGHWSSNCPQDGKSGSFKKSSYSSNSDYPKRGRGGSTRGGSTRGGKRGRGAKKSKFGAPDDF